MRSFLKVSSELISYFSMFLKMPESMTLSVLFWLTFCFFCSRFSDIRLTLPLICPKSYSNFLKRLSRLMRFYELGLSRMTDESNLSWSIFTFMCLMIISSSSWMVEEVHFYAFNFIVFLQGWLRFVWDFIFFSWWMIVHSCRFLFLLSG